MNSDILLSDNALLIFAISMVLVLLLIFWLITQLIKLRRQLIILENNYQHQLDTLELEFAEEKRLAVEQAKKRSRTSQRNQIKGQLGERFTPFMGGFPYNPSDCRFLGEPIDFIIFNNLHECSDGLVPIEEVEMIIADVKTGDARLSQRQRILQYIIENGQVRFETFRVADEAMDRVQVEVD